MTLAARLLECALLLVGSVLVGWGDWDGPAPCGIRNLRLWFVRMYFQLAYFGGGITGM